MTVPSPSTKYLLQSDVVDSVGSMDGTSSNLTFANDTTLNRDVAIFSNSHFEAPMQLATQITSMYSVSMWVYLDSIGPDYMILFTDHRAGQAYASLDARVLASGQLEIRHRKANANASRIATSTATLQTGQWTHIAFAWSSVIGMAIYIDGSLDSTKSMGYIPYNSTQPMKFGVDRTGSGYSNRFQGKMADIRWWKSNVLDSVQIGVLYSEGADGASSASPAVEIAHYTLDADAQDSVGSNHATTNDITFSDGAANFDGTLAAYDINTSYIELGQPQNFGLQDFSVSFWYNPSSAALSTGRDKRWLMSVLGNYGGSSMRLSGWTLYFESTMHLTYEEYSSHGGLRECTTSTESAKAEIGTWKHVALAVNGSKISIYVDGNLEEEIQQSRNDDIQYGTIAAYLGRVSDNSKAGGAGESYAGSMDDVHFYNGMLDASEVSSLYACLLYTSPSPRD